MTEIHERVIGAVTVLKPQGRLVLSENQSDNALRDRIRVLMQQGCRQFVIDLSDVSHVDTSGLTTLVGAYIAVRKREGRITLLKPAKRVRELLGVTRLNTIFETFETEDEVLAALGVTRPSQP